LLCCKEGWRCGITPAEENTYAREPICPYRKTRLPHRPTNTPYLRPPQKPTRLHLPPARRLRHAQNLPQLHLPRPISGSLPLTKCAKSYNLPVCLTIPPSTEPSLNFHNSSGSSKGDALLQHLQVNEMTVAVDTTGFRNDTASAYYQSRRGGRRRSWHKGGFVVGTESQLIVGMQVGRGPGSDAKWLAPLRAQARRYVVRKGRSARFWLLADAGFDGRDVEWTDVVPPIRRGGRLRAWSRVLRAALVERAKASGLYGQRWKVETVISVIKRKFGDGVRRWGLRLARREVLAKGVAYNLHRSFFVVVCVWCVR